MYKCIGKTATYTYLYFERRTHTRVINVLRLRSKRLTPVILDLRLLQQYVHCYTRKKIFEL